jgi:phosphonoacetate hydrolase
MNKLFFLICFFYASVQVVNGQEQIVPEKRVVIFMIDGFGIDYLENSNMPVLKEILMKKGFHKQVKSMMPSVTNCNNASICCGTAAAAHGVVGNTFVNNTTGEKEFLESGDLVMSPTIFQRARKHEIKSALFSSKLKTISLLSAGTEFTVCPEAASPEWTGVAGPPPGKYTREVNYWTLKCAIHTLKSKPDIKLLYIHTTDYAMHTWAPETKESKEHLFKLDSLIGEVMKSAPDAAIFITADHGMNHKSKVWDLQKVLKNRNINIRTAISPLADKYPKHHSGYGGVCYLYLNNLEDEHKVKKVLKDIPGIEKIYTRAQASEKFQLMPERIGDLVILGDKTTVFGELENAESNPLPENYRTHGSAHESDVPLFIYNIEPLPPPSFFKNNKDIVRWLY